MLLDPKKRKIGSKTSDETKSTSGFPTVLEWNSDANWISDSDDTKSTSGGAVTWRH